MAYLTLDVKIDSEEVVLDIRAKALALYAQGNTIMKWQGEGVSAEKSFVAPIKDILEETRIFLKSLNPAKYGYPLTNKKIFRA